MDFLNTEEKRERRLVHLPMGRFGEAVELARAALFCAYHRLPSVSAYKLLMIDLANPVASDDSSYITVCIYGHYLTFLDFVVFKGTDFAVDGGLSSAYVTPTGKPALSPPASLV